MNTDYEDLKKSLDKAIFYLKDIKATKKKFEVEELMGLESD